MFKSNWRIYILFILMQSMYRTLESPKRLRFFLIAKILLIATSTWISLKSSDFDYNIYSIEKGFQSWNSTTYVDDTTTLNQPSNFGGKNTPFSVFNLWLTDKWLSSEGISQAHRHWPEKKYIINTHKFLWF